ncbi:DUF2807 domain-containing protein [Spirochaetia bacterium 38H-sp]|uniref:DUF2807 domain-containing protein n=1 Tax=Rarispira pelagica TaxID=3141764 RepID=A0ABU9UEB0_9SPIR
MRKKISNRILLGGGIVFLVFSFFIVLIVFLYNGQSKKQDIASTIESKFSFPDGKYAGLDIHGSWSVFVSFGDVWNANFNIKRGNPSDVKVSVSGSVLIVDVVSGSDVKGDIYVTMPELKTLSVLGSSDISIKGFEEKKLDVNVSGAANISAEDCSFSLLGLDISGAGAVDFSSVSVDDVVLDLSGASSVKIMANKSVKGEVSGVSSVVIYGNPEVVDIDSSGLASVLRK